MPKPYKSFKHRIGLKPVDRWFRLTAEKIKAWNKSCYNEYKRSDGSCSGLAGGDKSTDYLQWGCASCEHFRMEDSIKDDDN